MSNVITQIDIMKFDGTEKAVFPAGTIVTPSARDWAQEHNIRIVIGGSSGTCKESTVKTSDSTEKELLLQQVINAVSRNMEKAGGFLSRDEFYNAVAASLGRLGCSVEQ